MINGSQAGPITSFCGASRLGNWVPDREAHHFLRTTPGRDFAATGNGGARALRQSERRCDGAQRIDDDADVLLERNAER